MASVAERCHDEAGLVWPVPIAPYEVIVTLLNPKNAEVSDAGGAIYDALVAEGIEVLLDDRDERPGVKFNDADLIGVPYRLTVGPKGVKQGEVELTRRKSRKSRSVDLQKAAANAAEVIFEERSETA
jgi:prolyl-tRNA synthetase